MKLFLVCLLLPVALAAPADTKRFIFGPIQIATGDLFDLDTLKCDVQVALDVIGSDPTEQACENECHHLLANGGVLNYGCDLFCHEFQALAHYFHEDPKPGDQNKACGGLILGVTTTAAMPTTPGPI